MRKLIFAINSTIDGCCDHTKGTGSDDILDYFTNLIKQSGLMVYGRKTYELMVPYWPSIAKDPSGKTKPTVDFAQTFDAVDKVVFSRTLQSVDDKHTTIVSTDLREEIVRLKQQPGKDILLGGVDLPSQLIMMGLVDEYIFVIQPSLAGDGARLLQGIDLPQQLQLKFAGAETLRSGSIALRYLSTNAEPAQ